MKRFIYSLTSGIGVVMLLTVAAFAHHGWDWTEDEQTELEGTITSVYIGPPHPRLTIQTENEGDWTVDLGNPRQTQAAGFVEGEAAEGDQVVVLGHRSRDSSENLIKAVRITIDEQQYDFYPELIQDND